MLPEETYNGPAAPRSIRRIETSYHEAGVCDKALMLFGIGDGGGGPGEEHLKAAAANEKSQRYCAGHTGLCHRLFPPYRAGP